MNTRTTNILKWTGISFLAIAILYTVLLALSNRSLANAYAALEADGRPMSVDEVIPAYIPDEENAALFYEAAVLLLRSGKAGDENLFSHLEKISRGMLVDNPEEETITLFRKLIQRKNTDDALSLIEQGTLKPGCRHDLDYSMGPDLPMPHLRGFLHVNLMLNAVARLQAIDGDYDAAWRTIIISLRLADSLRDESLFISQLVRATMFKLTVDTIQGLCGNSTPPPNLYAELVKMLTSFEDNAPFVAAIDSERMFLGRWVFDHPGPGLRETAAQMAPMDYEDDGLGIYIGLATIFPPLFHRDHATYLRVTHESAKTAAQLYTSKDSNLEEGLFKDVPRYCILTRLLVSTSAPLKAYFSIMNARARTTRVALGTLLYRQDHDSYPKNLTDLNLGNLADPFLGEPLHYSVIANGFTIYSVGPNLIDDGGQRSKDSKKGDIVWKYVENEKAKEN